MYLDRQHVMMSYRRTQFRCWTRRRRICKATWKCFMRWLLIHRFDSNPTRFTNKPGEDSFNPSTLVTKLKTLGDFSATSNLIRDLVKSRPTVLLVLFNLLANLLANLFCLVKRIDVPSSWSRWESLIVEKNAYKIQSENRCFSIR